MTNTEKLEKSRRERVGEVAVNKYGTSMKLIEYIDCKHVIVQFQDEHGHQKKTTYRDFSLGKVDNPYDKTMFGIGYRGVGKYGALRGNKKIYQVWQDMFRRCYGHGTNDTKPCYSGCSIAEVWHNFQNFASWYEENYYNIDGQIMQIDKDILQKGNKIYSPETCILVPNEINALIVKRKLQRGDTPIGVYYNKNMGVYVAFCWTNECQKEYLGRYNTPEDAFFAYKKRKEQYIKEVADKYENKIPKRLYDALCAYKVEITD